MSVSTFGHFTRFSVKSCHRFDLYCSRRIFQTTLQKQQSTCNTNIVKRFLASRQSETHARGTGICFDIDGVIARGSRPLPEAQEAFRLLERVKKKKYFPVVFVTNALNRDEDKARQLSEWLGIKVQQVQMVQAQAPLFLYTEYHHKHCLFLGKGQDNLRQIAYDLGFTNISIIEDIVTAFPLLEASHHKMDMNHFTQVNGRGGFQPVEAIISLTQPNHWDTVLQLTCDLLLTHGDPSRSPHQVESTADQLPVIVANVDLQYMHSAHIPRFGHGSFLLCLEQLYKKLTGRDLKYRAIVGKPSEATFRIAEHKLNLVAKNDGNDELISHMYMIGDNPHVDIVAANLYQEYTVKIRQEGSDESLPVSRRLPPGHPPLTPQTVQEVRGILVQTGVYHRDMDTSQMLAHSHRDFELRAELVRPSLTVDSVLDAVKYIIAKES